jgi:antitoxin component of MazEF toxin-antitoxin module
MLTECVYVCAYMEADSKIARYGNRLTVRLPVAVARELDLRDGDKVTLRTTSDGVVIERPKRSRLTARLATVHGREPEIGTGRAVGAEILK